MNRAEVLKICGARGFSGLKDWARQSKQTRQDFTRRIKAGETRLRPLLDALENEWRTMIAPNLKS